MSGLFDDTPLERPVTCEVCLQPLSQCACPRDEGGSVLLPQDQPLRIRCEKRRRGKVVTLITGFNPSASDVHAVSKQLRALCAAGGKALDDCIEIQGDHRERLAAALRRLGYPVRLIES